MEEQVVLGFTGDIMCDNLDNMIAHKFNGFISENVSNCLKSVDYCVGNLETPIVNDIQKNKERYSFCAPKEFAKKLNEYGFDMFSTANNHCLDRGINGLIENCDNLEKLKIDYTGTNKFNKQRVLIRNFKGIKISFISYTYGTNAFLNNNYLNDDNFFYVNLSRKQETSNRLYRKLKNKFCENLFIFNPIRDKKYLKRIKEDLDYAKINSDFVVFLLHSGGQYNNTVEHYTKKLCNFIKKNGADLIVGNHPHVVLNRKDNIYYSLGNFYATPFSNHNQVDDIPNYSVFLKVTINKKDIKIDSVDYNIFKTEIKDNFPITFNVNEIKNKQTEEELKYIINKFNGR